MEKQVSDVLVYQDPYTYNEILKAKKSRQGSKMWLALGTTPAIQSTHNSYE